MAGVRSSFGTKFGAMVMRAVRAVVGVLAAVESEPAVASDIEARRIRSCVLRG